MNSCSLFFSVLPWMSFPRKHHLSLPSAFSHLAKRLVQPVIPVFRHQSLKCRNISDELSKSFALRTRCFTFITDCDMITIT
ncbi:hypothetical protein M405DRAFT_146027 [Rhizopogon salebrosus TDB-379]|nr:hypothetical protein M405DRAFT_146027 [Rhizopogon salebrosus TDB-379]